MKVARRRTDTTNIKVVHKKRKARKRKRFVFIYMYAPRIDAIVIKARKNINYPKFLMPIHIVY